ncbi:PLP-dependent transferase [Dothidotthia symphoricarpi CBS 119687]|uniref:PLP-dependent transferase n=1 Tax=Dothidotthia symphoricarpi CBS 119687 TaxID=1392245 RepID=A0A6A6ADF7_9PLEO|nr:PLP-dependent transferase [Dothidotthia symphoricarpi CBS 119687]KAF2129586.1 PLP-dependent transferase [Dothidotthia symphoricarpi CBS 119687]
MSRVPAGLWKNLLAIQVYGANTGVGKTVFSTLLGSHFSKRLGGKTKWRVQYIKPVSTGPADEADDSYVHKYSGSPVSTLFKFQDAVSPHVAARDAPHIPSDDHICQRLFASLRGEANKHAFRRGYMGLSLVETAGGVLSPGPSGTPQADIFRPLRLPVVLVGDHRLGGIASTISAAESLIMRGYDIDAVVCFDDKSKYENAAYLKNYFKKLEIAAFDLPWIPNLEGVSEQEEGDLMWKYYQTESLAGQTYRVADRLIDRHLERMTNMRNMAFRTKTTIWHPFTQHKHVEKANDILVFDSAYGDYFQVKHTEKSCRDIGFKSDTSLFYPAFDGSASWWTQGLGHGNPRLALETAYAAGRYGHVMFAGATHEPALTLAERVLEGLDNPRLKKVFYTDDGSTATEVGIKMGIRAMCKRYGWNGAREEVGILGLKGSYHGDTIGAMDASEPNVYNEKTDWYRGRGYWFDYPTFKMRGGQWIVEPPAGMIEEFGPAQYFKHQDDIFNLKSRGRSLPYEVYIEKTLDKLVKQKGKKFGALVMEPVILGAGGMIFVDPLFQQSLVRVVRRYNFSPASEAAPLLEADKHDWSGLPVVFDEVFTGLYRLGRFSSSTFLGVHPDISVHAKLLTGGLLPLSITAASESIFQAFWGDEKSEALLHGHSYTAHPIGCHVANVSLETMGALPTSYAWRGYKKDWKTVEQETATGRWSLGVVTPEAGEDKSLWSMWSQKFVVRLSKHKLVDHVNALGSVLAISLVDKTGSGYTSTAAVELRDALLNEPSFAQVQIHSRILGNVIYLMASMTSKPGHLAAVEAAFEEKLDNLK